MPDNWQIQMHLTLRLTSLSMGNGSLVRNAQFLLFNANAYRVQTSSKYHQFSITIWFAIPSCHVSQPHLQVPLLWFTCCTVESLGFSVISSSTPRPPNWCEQLPIQPVLPLTDGLLIRKCFFSQPSPSQVASSIDFAASETAAQSVFCQLADKLGSVNICTMVLSGMGPRLRL